jgi:hypothetical protein
VAVRKRIRKVIKGLRVAGLSSLTETLSYDFHGQYFLDVVTFTAKENVIIGMPNGDLLVPPVMLRRYLVHKMRPIGSVFKLAQLLQAMLIEEQDKIFKTRLDLYIKMVISNMVAINKK